MSVAPRSTPINANARSKVIDPTPNRVNWHALYRRPAEAIGRGTEHDVVGITARFKPAVVPRNVHFACGINLGRRQIRIADERLLKECDERRNCDSATPTGPTVRRAKCSYVGNRKVRLELYDRHNDGP